MIYAKFRLLLHDFLISKFARIILASGVAMFFGYAQAQTNPALLKPMTGTYKTTPATRSESNVSSVALHNDGSAVLLDAKNLKVATYSSRAISDNTFETTLTRADGSSSNAKFTVTPVGKGIRVQGTSDGAPFDITWDENGKASPGSKFPDTRASDAASARALQEALQTRLQMHALTDACKTAIALAVIAAVEGGPGGVAVGCIFMWYDCHR